MMMMYDRNSHDKIRRKTSIRLTFLTIMLSLFNCKSAFAQGFINHHHSKPKLAADFGGTPGFYHGVASGDPRPDAIVIWTRFTPCCADAPVEIEYRIAQVQTDELPLNNHLNPTTNPQLRTGVVMARPESDWTIKVDVTGLESHTNYVFAFVERTNATTSMVGQTQTAPAANDNVTLTFAVFSCALYTSGYFHAYDIASTISDLDGWMHGGDYIYEYGNYVLYGGDAPQRNANLEPAWEVSTLADYRLRYAQYHQDPGLQNLRRRAPLLVSTWDDHEFADNAYGNPYEGLGAKNHQEQCDAHPFSIIVVKQLAQCDRDEGNVVDRFQSAKQAYLEWMPIRSSSTNNALDFDLTQVVEWGSLATILTVDSRMSNRSMDPTIQSNKFLNDFTALALNATNVSAYNESPLQEEFAALADQSREIMYNESFTMIGPTLESFVQETLANSKALKKPWQIYVQATMMGPLVMPDFSTMYKHVPEQHQQNVKAFMDNLLANEVIGALPRAASAMSMYSIPFNRDDYNGFAAERARLLHSFQEDANNVLVLGGDLHDSWAWILYHDNNETINSVPVAVNLGGPSVSAPGLENVFAPVFFRLIAQVGESVVWDMLHQGFYEANQGLVYSEMEQSGFFVVQVTQDETSAEYFQISQETLLSDYETARRNSGSITANFTCGASLVTHADEPGSLEKRNGCGRILFETKRPAVWSMSVSGENVTSTNSGCIGMRPMLWLPLMFLLLLL